MFFDCVSLGLGFCFVQSREGVKKVELVGESCEGVADMDGCLKKRTLTADIDYIYSVDP